ncbi:hypothetical protein N431DRAFT_437789 [Stipitochalara longipes BDJ]|nr:hypothetical protein N431DRAFT_437789 [Stipitochalara longipes BDJ]
MVAVLNIPENGAGSCRRLQSSSLLFVTYSGGARLKRQDQARIHSHVRNRNHVRQRKERAVYEIRRQRQVKLQPAPNVDFLLGLGDFDPFNTLPIRMSSSDMRVLDYFSRYIAPLHYPPGLVPKYKHTNSTTRVAAAMTDAALLHSILGATNGHLLFYAKMPTISLSDVLYHKTKAMRMVNEKLALASSNNLTDETLAAVAILITSQTRQGDYDEMKIHLGGLLQLVGLRGGLEMLGMRGLLAGEIRWCDNVTALSSSAKPLLSGSELSKLPYKTFKDDNLNTLFGTSAHNKSSPLSNPALLQLLSAPLITTLHDLQYMTDMLNTIPQFSEHDMLVYDQHRASIQHEIANISVSAPHTEYYHIKESCRLTTAIYSILAMYSFRPPLKLYGDLARRLKEILVMVDRVCFWGPWRDLLLWILFVGGYAALGRVERGWFVGMAGVVLKEREMKEWDDVRRVIGGLPVHHMLWEPFEGLWHETVSNMFDTVHQAVAHGCLTDGSISKE